jgi:hypothetical protein
VPDHLHLSPERLGEHAVAAADLSEELRAAVHGAPESPGSAGEAEDRVHAAVCRAARELAALAAGLAGAAAAGASADRAVARSFDGLQP